MVQMHLTSRLGQHHLHQTTVSFKKGAFAVAQVIVPHADKSVVEAKSFDVLDLLDESSPPVS